MTELCFKSCIQIPSVPKTFKIIEFFLALIKEFYQIVVASDEFISLFKVPEFSFARSLVNSLDRKLLKLKKQSLERTTSSYTSMAYISDIFLRPLFI